METTTKICKDCQVELPLESYYFRNAKGRHDHRCKSCYAIRRKPATLKYRLNNPEKIKENTRKYGGLRREEKKAYAKQYHLKNREQGLQQRKEWYLKQDREKQLEKRREWYRQNKEKHAAAREKYALENKEKLRAARRKWENERLMNDLAYRLKNALASRVRAVTKGRYKKQQSTVELIGCSIEEFRDYIEAQFQEGMTWENWSTEGWHLDHRIPLSWFNLENENCRKLAFHHTNMQPLWSGDNLDKKNFYHHKLYNHNQ